MISSNTESKVLKKVDPNLYDLNYYLSNNIGCEEFKDGLLLSRINYKFQEVLKCCSFASEKRVLDIGCGRGELVYYSVMFGCKEAIGIDYSCAAIELANTFKSKLENDIQLKMKFMNMDVLDLSENNKFDYVFLIEVWEHLYDEQLMLLIKKISSILKNDGTFIITTPNLYYEKYLYPAKRILNIPGNFFKFPLRIIRGKWKPASLKDLFKHIFKIRPFPNSFMDATHVNVSSPYKIRKLLEASGFKVKIRCCDSSLDPLTFLFKCFAGREMLITAKLGSEH